MGDGDKKGLESGAMRQMVENFWGGMACNTAVVRKQKD